MPCGRWQRQEALCRWLRARQMPWDRGKDRTSSVRKAVHEEQRPTVLARCAEGIPASFKGRIILTIGIS